MLLVLVKLVKLAKKNSIIMYISDLHDEDLEIAIKVSHNLFYINLAVSPFN